MNDRMVSAPSAPQIPGLPCNGAALLAALAFTVFLGGCITYTPQELSAMPGLQLCEMQLYSRVNLKDETKRLVQNELSRRKEDCRKYVPEIEADREWEREQAMYCCTGP